ncbi:hypothetical protein BAUCODRAFT_566140 [Baudoinia panamericana UAMH 10762]|uniref:O-methyltransferase C-terminal domain-containing protein n=1 Tax=Baudoinia panamericana (strain UAMH 10762) TaxID=717646 RepID=M2NMM3_BAUPA|nr:uncharacterized protein BAUCODRAFT_566140 [Baudoinia panamericana UAMH 10762]EMD00436.1 hypothetical protein BAUCODRAFT_566140 [Baudoinia panamericana UAMH 10762]
MANGQSAENLAPLELLANDISGAAKIIEGYCVLEHEAHPTGDATAPAVTIPSSAPRYVREARQRLLSAAKAIQQIAAEPTEYLPTLAVQYQYLACVKWLAHFQVFAAIPLQGSVPYDRLASIVTTPERQLRSILRMAITSGCFCEPVLGEVAHNAVSRKFVDQPGYLGWIKFMDEYYMPLASNMAQTTERYGDSQKPNETATNVAFSTPLTTFDFITRSPDLSKIFSAYMKSVAESEGTTLRHLIADFDWAKLGEALVVHVAGAPGSVSVALAEAYPKLRFLVQDSAEQIEHSRAFLRAQTGAIRSRIELAVHTVFKMQPVTNASVYLLRMSLHTRPAAEVKRVLACLLPAVKANANARILVVETVIPLPGSCGILDEALERYRDLVMKQCFNTIERELPEWHAMLGSIADAEGHLEIVNVEKSPGSALSSLEVKYQRHHTNGVLANTVNGGNGRS